ncbi:Alpha/Beta hydrolase protein [Mycena sp. CBHHK59/15]|nr:Alpha/Beta hydrolase protein [Mycena sp. CBHHK59/15]
MKDTRMLGIQLNRVATVIVLSLTALLFYERHTDASLHNRANFNGVDSRVAQADKFAWDTIEPTEELIWKNCYSGNQCARLKVPLDYSNPGDASAAIAMVRLHSVVPHNSTSYRGPVLINPGGPGGSGVDVVLGRGSMLAAILGPEFDIIGFDPRGISRSTPRVSFFETRAEREIWGAQLIVKSMNASTDALPRAWARSLITGQLAGERDKGSLRYINTDHTARDMLRIVQAHGREKLQYWGFSYGSVLGATFASMFPDNVERLVIDGVADSENYFATEWSNNLLDADKSWASFMDGCAAAGPDGCPFYAPTASAISDKVNQIYASLRARPIPVRTNTSYGLVDYSMLRKVIFEGLYSPFATSDAGNGTALLQLAQRPAFECGCDPAEFRFESVGDAGTAVVCNDGKPISAKFEDAERHYREVSRTSSWADMWMTIRMPCSTWPDFPKDHFQGPFVANTSFPLLLVGNTAGLAKKMSKGFPGSVVLTQDSAGHCSISAPSLSPDTVCPVIGSPFPAADLNDAADAQVVLALSAADRSLLEVLRELAMSFDIRFPGL